MGLFEVVLKLIWSVYEVVGVICYKEVWVVGSGVESEECVIRLERVYIRCIYNRKWLV